MVIDSLVVIVRYILYGRYTMISSLVAICSIQPLVVIDSYTLFGCYMVIDNLVVIDMYTLYGHYMLIDSLVVIDNIYHMIAICRYTWYVWSLYAGPCILVAIYILWSL